MLLDGDRLRERMEEMQSSLAQAVEQRISDNDGQKDEATVRMEGGIANLHVLLTQLHHFEVTTTDSRRKTVPSQQTPINEIDAPTKLKVGRFSPGTSWEAAYLQTSERSRPLYRAIYLALSTKGPMNDDELRHALRSLLEKYGYAPEGVTMRRGELVRAGWVKATDLRRPGDSGSSMTVWEAVPENGNR